MPLVNVSWFLTRLEWGDTGLRLLGRADDVTFGPGRISRVGLSLP